MVDKDASKYSMGITLLQKQNLTEEKEFETIEFWEKTCTGTEREYSSTE